MLFFKLLLFVIAVFETDVLSEKLTIPTFIDKGNSSYLINLMQKIIEFDNIHSITLNPTLTFGTIDTLHALCKRLDDGQLPFLGNINTWSYEIIHTFSRQFGIPFFTWDRTLALHHILSDHDVKANNYVLQPLRRPPQQCYVFNIRPDLIKPTIDFLVSWEWHEFNYIYSSEQSFSRMQFILSSLIEKVGPEINQHVRSYHVSANETYTRIFLRDMDKKFGTSSDNHSFAYRRFLLDIGDTLDIKQFLQVLKQLGMLRREYHYFIMDYGIWHLPLGPYKPSGVTITGYMLLDYDNLDTVKFQTNCNPFTDVGVDINEIAFLSDTLRVISALMNKENSKLIAQKSKISCYDSKFNKRTKVVNWTNIVPWENSKYIMDKIGRLRFSGRTGRIQFNISTCSRTNYSIILSQFNGDQGSTTIARWTQRSSKWQKVEHLLSRLAIPGHSKRSQHATVHSMFFNRTIRVVTILEKPFVMLKKGIPPNVTHGKANFEGYCIDLANLVFELAGVNYEMFLVKDGNYGAPDKNDTWNGIVGELLRNEADVAIGPVTVSSRREKVIDFCEPFMTFGLSVIFKKPSKKKSGTYSFLKPLSNSVWLTILSAAIGLTLGLFVIARISPYEWNRGSPCFNIPNSFWFVFASFVQQGVPFAPLSPGARILSSVWWLFSLLIMAYYTANLAAFLSVERLVSPISHLKDIVEKSSLGIEVGTLKSGSTRQFFANSRAYPFDAVYSLMQSDPSVFAKTIDEGVQRVRTSSGTYAFILESKMTEYLNHRLPCDTIQIGEVFGNKEYAMATSSPKYTDEGKPLTSYDLLLETLKDRITDSILRLRESQDLARLYKIWWIDKGQCQDQAGDSSSSSPSLDLANLSGVFYILILGILVSLAVAIGGFCRIIIIHRYRTAHKLSDDVLKVDNVRRYWIKTTFMEPPESETLSHGIVSTNSFINRK